MLYASLLFGLFILLKQFYILPSGSLGLGDICLLCSFLCIICSKRSLNDYAKHIHKDILFYAFIGCTILINGAYGIAYSNPEFLKHSLYWGFSGIAIYMFRFLYSDKFLRFLASLLKIDIGIQLLVFIFGVGRNYYETWGGTRYMGTFNDPNQFAFFIFTSLILLYFYAVTVMDKSYPIFFVVGLFLISVSKSAGIFLGIFIFMLCLLFNGVRKVFKDGNKTVRWLLLVAVLSLILVLGLLLNRNFGLDGEFTLISRVTNKIELIKSGGFKRLLFDRSAQGILIYPQYLLYGAGEGGLARFSNAGITNEIHCSILSILFCYGVGPTFILLYWLRVNLVKIDYRACFGLVALLVESMFLINYRQPFFWMIIIWASLLNRETSHKYETQTNDITKPFRNLFQKLSHNPK